MSWESDCDPDEREIRNRQLGARVATLTAENARLREELAQAWKRVNTVRERAGEALGRDCSIEEMADAIDALRLDLARVTEDNKQRIECERIAYESRNAAQARCNTADREAARLRTKLAALREIIEHMPLADTVALRAALAAGEEE